jgi:hypothetical protein
MVLKTECVATLVPCNGFVTGAVSVAAALKASEQFSPIDYWHIVYQFNDFLVPV